MIANLNKTDPDTTIIDELFDAAKSSSYNLYLCGGEDGLSMAVLDVSASRFIALQSYSFSPGNGLDDFCRKLEHIFENDALLGDSGFKQVVFSYIGNKSTLVPDPLFNEDHAVEYLSFNFPVSGADNIHMDQLKLLGARNVFAIPGAVENIVREKFPQALLRHYSSPFIESLLLNNKNRDEKIITVHVHLSGFEMAVTKRNELIFYNSFHYKSTEDFLYFVLNTMEQLELNPETTPFIFTGSAERSSALYITTRKYIRFVGFGERTEHFSFSYDFENIPAHYHYLLFNLHLCAS